MPLFLIAGIFLYMRGCCCAPNRPNRSKPSSPMRPRISQMAISHDAFKTCKQHGRLRPLVPHWQLRPPPPPAKAKPQPDLQSESIRPQSADFWSTPVPKKVQPIEQHWVIWSVPVSIHAA